MKIRSMFSALFLNAIALALLVNCSGNKKENHEGHDIGDSTSQTSVSPTDEMSASQQFQVDPNFQTQLARVFTSYIELKNAFVSSDETSVKEKAKATNEALAKVDMALLTGAAYNDWMNYRHALQTSLKEIQSGTDIEVERKIFSDLSDNLYKSIKAFGLGGKEAYYEFCPMALDNGAYWLSDQEQIRNPYFGDKMLTCGSVKEKIK
jgi:hypothetical protein